MREAKFRGLNRNSHKWYYGSLLVTRQLGIHHAQIWLLDEDYPVPVDIETTGEWIGLTDKNNTEIYEGDIVWNTALPKSRRDKYVVEWTREEDEQLEMVGFLVREGPEWEIIGNIYENPELLSV